MKAVILAAGEGIRMRPLTLETPKPLLKVLGQPLIDYTFDALPNQVTEVVMVVGYRAEQLHEYLGETYKGKRVRYVTQQKLAGPGDALFLAQEYLMDEEFFTFYADDIYVRSDVEKLLPHRYGMLLAHADDPARFGVVECAKNGCVLGIEEKPAVPKTNLVSTGVFKLDDKIFNYRVPPRPNGEMYLAEMVGALAQQEEVQGIVSEQWIQIAYPDDLKRAEEVLRQD